MIKLPMKASSSLAQALERVALSKKAQREEQGERGLLPPSPNAPQAHSEMDSLTSLALLGRARVFQTPRRWCQEPDARMQAAKP